MSGEVDTGRDPGEQQPVAAAIPVPEPTPVVSSSEATHAHPPGTAASSSGGPAVIGPPDKPELAVGAAFAGGLLFALILKRITN